MRRLTKFHPGETFVMNFNLPFNPLDVKAVIISFRNKDRVAYEAIATSFQKAHVSGNMFNAEDYIDKKNVVNGVLADNNSYFSTKYIPINGGHNYRIVLTTTPSTSATVVFNWYKSDKTYISSETCNFKLTESGTVTSLNYMPVPADAPNNAGYVVVSFPKAYFKPANVALYDTGITYSTTYESYYSENHTRVGFLFTQKDSLMFDENSSYFCQLNVFGPNSSRITSNPMIVETLEQHIDETNFVLNDEYNEGGEITEAKTTNYNSLSNLPTINGNVAQGNIVLPQFPISNAAIDSTTRNEGV